MARAQRDASSRARRSRPTPRWLANTPDLDQVARNRVMLVLSVLSGEKPVTTAIEEAQISRDFYYGEEDDRRVVAGLAPLDRDDFIEAFLQRGPDKRGSGTSDASKAGGEDDA